MTFPKHTAWAFGESLRKVSRCTSQFLGAKIPVEELALHLKQVQNQQYYMTKLCPF